MDDFMFVKKFCLMFNIEQNIVNTLKQKGKLPGKKDEKGRFLVDVGAALDLLQLEYHRPNLYDRKQIIRELRIQNEDVADQAILMLERDIHTIEDLRNRCSGLRKAAERYKMLYEQAKLSMESKAELC